MVKRFFVASVCAVALFTSAPAQAAPILVTDSSGVVGAVFFDLAANPVFMNLAAGGASGATVSDGAVITSGIIAVSDTDSALFVDFGVDDAFLFDFNFATSVFAANLWSVVVNGAPIFLTDPALVPFAGANLGQFSLLSLDPFFDTGTQQQIGFVGLYKLDFIAAQGATPIPEPATLGFVGTGILLAIRRRRSKRNIVTSTL